MERHTHRESLLPVGILDLGLLEIFGRVVDSVLLLLQLGLGGDLAVDAGVELCGLLGVIAGAVVGVLGFGFESVDLLLGLCDVL